jgi:hypothetical protein
MPPSRQTSWSFSGLLKKQNKVAISNLMRSGVVSAAKMSFFSGTFSRHNFSEARFVADFLHLIDAGVSIVKPQRG